MTCKAHTTDTCMIGEKEYFTRHWYMNSAKDMDSFERHHKFFTQFCTPSVLTYVVNSFNQAEWRMIEKANDHKYLNGIFELKRWDRIAVQHLIGSMYTKCCYSEYPKGVHYWAPSDNTCIVKSAVRILLERSGQLKKVVEE